MSNSANNSSQHAIFCNLCDRLSASSLDYESKVNTGVCRDCDLKFAQPNMKKWNSGWRPTAEEVKSFKQETRKTVYSILNDINNYI